MAHPTPPGEASSMAELILDRIPHGSEELHVHPEAGLQALMADRHHRIRVAAYYLAERRGFAPGHELDDWLAAEDAIEAEDAGRAAED
jgi:Protein of unknown function (DUF2934)